ncbi:MAG TPA: hypothetical protein VIK72_08025 [Clostridiaceae bacterium]
MNKTGLVLKVSTNYITLVTDTGEFVRVAALKTMPEIGETFTGTVRRKVSYQPFLKYAVALLLIFSTSAVTYAYYTPVTSIDVSIHPSVGTIKLKANVFSKVLLASPTNKDGISLLKDVQLKNINVDAALTIIVEKAKKDNIINNDYINSGKSIEVKISTNDTEKIISLDKFNSYVSENKINTTIDNNGKINNEKFVEAPKDTKEGTSTIKENNTKVPESSNKNATKQPEPSNKNTTKQPEPSNKNATVNDTNKTNKDSFTKPLIDGNTKLNGFSNKNTSNTDKTKKKTIESETKKNYQNNKTTNHGTYFNKSTNSR